MSIVRPVFVTSYFTIYPTGLQETRPFEWRLEKFRQLLETGIYVVLFTDNFLPFVGLMREFKDTFRIGKVMTLQETDLVQTFSSRIQNLPYSSNPDKDTAEFFWVMMLKTELLERAIQMDVFGTGSSIYCWIDFSIAYIFKSPASTLAFLRTIGHSALDINTVYIPGCWGEPQTANFDNQILWRFCGGIVIGHVQHLLEMNRVVRERFQEFLDAYEGTLTWEVNYWAWLEYRGYFHPTWYYADHDDWMILGIPSRACFSRVVPLFQQVLNLLPVTGFTNKWTPSSAAFLRGSDGRGGGYLLVRYVNYRLNDEGAYLFPDVSDKGVIRNQNMLFRMEPDPNGMYHVLLETGILCTLSEPVAVDPPFHPISTGLEDIRLWTDAQGNTCCIGTNVDQTCNNLPQVFTGDFDLSTATITNFTLHQTDEMQKNWIFWNNDEVVYRWNIDCLLFRHLQTGIIRKVPFRVSNSILSSARGSTIFLSGWNAGERVAVVHYSEEGHPRKYYHVLVVLQETTGELVRHSLPFYLGKNGADGQHCVNFCIGFDWTINPQQPDDHLFHFWFSIMDRDPEYWVVSDTKQIKWCSYEGETSTFTMVKKWLE